MEIHAEENGEYSCCLVHLVIPDIHALLLSLACQRSVYPVTATPCADFPISNDAKSGNHRLETPLWLFYKTLIVRVYTMKSYQKLSKIFKTSGLSHCVKPELAPLAALIGHIDY
ncbi:hypothetical protein [Aeromonas sp. HMWF016]|uniref:hypothetical protein n=1 Tax=Aeromonas sp. HMWF016 TaxID=2056852 RepID=UPI0011B21C46|nr:hypothetical protein [Aeromonas sp. HMWF016]